jgi:uncharacterized protein (UPF0147 family)
MAQWSNQGTESAEQASSACAMLDEIAQDVSLIMQMNSTIHLLFKNKVPLPQKLINMS